MSSTAGTLSSSSNLAKAVGVGSNCGAGAPGGEGTYYAQVIYQAQADLATEQASNHNANMMIILSDGDATACNSQSYPTDNCGGNTPYSNKFQIQASNCPYITNANDTKTVKISNSAPCDGSYTGQPLNGTFCSTSSSTTAPTCTATIDPANYQSPTFPSAVGECGQAVVAAQYATSQGTKVYTIGYGTETSGSCQTDTTYSASVTSTTNGGNTWGPGDQACAAMGAMASTSSYFFSDQYNKCDSGDPNNVGITSLASIFQHIGANVTSARLIPNSAT